MQLVGWLMIILAGVLVTSVAWPTLIGAAWSPSSLGIVRTMLDMAEVQPNDAVYDLGSGDGRIVVEAARRYGARAVGIEADPLRLAWSRAVVSMLRLRGKVRIVWGNFFHEDIAEATVVTLFLTQAANQRLESKLRRELREGTRVVSYSWTFDGWTPVKVDREADVHMYVIRRREPERCDAVQSMDLSLPTPFP